MPNCQRRRPRDHPQGTANARSGADDPRRDREHPQFTPPPRRSPETTISAEVRPAYAIRRGWGGLRESVGRRQSTRAGLPTGASSDGQSVRQPSEPRYPRHQLRPSQRQLRSSRNERPGAGGTPAHAVIALNRVQSRRQSSSHPHRSYISPGAGISPAGDTSRACGSDARRSRGYRFGWWRCRRVRASSAQPEGPPPRGAGGSRRSGAICGGSWSW